MDLVSETRSHGGVQQVVTHVSKSCGVPMTFGIYLPPQAEDGPVPVLWFLFVFFMIARSRRRRGGGVLPWLILGSMGGRRSSGWHGGGGWHVDYPDSDLNFSYRLQELTSMEVAPGLGT